MAAAVNRLPGPTIGRRYHSHDSSNNRKPNALQTRTLVQRTGAVPRPKTSPGRGKFSSLDKQTPRGLEVVDEQPEIPECKNRDAGGGLENQGVVTETDTRGASPERISRPSSGVSACSRVSSRVSGITSPYKKTIARVAKRSRPSSSIQLGENERTLEAGTGQDKVIGSESEALSDSDDLHPRAPSDFDLGGSLDIAGEGWDTDLEIEAEAAVTTQNRKSGRKRKDLRDAFDASGKAVYLESCRRLGVIPASYFLRHMTDATLDMKHHGLGPAGVRPLAVALVSNTRVTTLNLADNWLGAVGGNHVCDMLRENCFISDMTLSDNRLSTPFAERFSNVLLWNNTLSHVCLSGNELNDQAASHIAEAITNTGNLEHLDLSHNMLGEGAGVALGPALAENSSLRSIDLSWNCIRRKGAAAIAKGIKNNVLLQKANLSWNGLGNDGAGAIGDALKQNATLEELDISNNRISTEGAVLFGKGVSLNETLRVVKMGKNPMQSAGCYAIGAAILKNPGCAIRELDFHDILVNADFYELFTHVKEQLPEIKLRIGSEVAKKPRVRVHPMMKLQNYITKHNLRLVDFFNRFDKDGSMSVTREEFAEGIETFIQETGIKLTEDEITLLLDELDKDGDGEINYSEMVLGHQDFTEKEKKMQSHLLQLNSANTSSVFSS